VVLNGTWAIIAVVALLVNLRKAEGGRDLGDERPGHDDTRLAEETMFKARDLALIAVFAALAAILGLPGALTPFGASVPITLQTLAPMMAGAILGWKRGMASAVVFLALVAVGLPLLAGGRGGLGLFVGPSAGYLFGWIAGTAVIGLLVQWRLPAFNWWWTGLSVLIGGIGVVYLIGVPARPWSPGPTGSWQPPPPPRSTCRAT
jgi:biotin transport system substrate-specific component